MNYAKKLTDFLQKKSELKKIIIIYGPTAAGKTSMSIDIAKQLDSEIISTDSRQLFKYMDIGTAKVSKEEMDGVKHHMIDFLDPNTIYSVGEFKQSSEEIINSLHSQNKIPLLVGGTGLYIDSLMYDFNIPEVIADWSLRHKLESEAAKHGVEHVYQKLVDIDPEFAKTLHPNNLQYVIRAIEVKLVSGKSKGDAKAEKIPKYDILFLTPEIESREWLYNRINYRVDLMFEQGLEEEIKKLLSMGYTKESFGMKSIGYSEYFDYLDGIYTFEEMKDMIKQNSRNYAKRQMTWFRKYKQ